MNTNYGLCWHVHHDALIEFCYDISWREKYIREQKPDNEIELRLRLFQRVRGKLPVKWDKTNSELARVEWDEVNAKCDRVSAELYKATVELSKTRVEWDKVGKWDKASATWNKARIELEKARVELAKFLADHSREIEALHAVECPSCPWNGETIFSR